MEGGANKERENIATWNTLAILSSNTYGMDYLSGGRAHSSKGEILRMLEWTPTQKLEFTSNEIEEIRLLSDHHGVAGEMWAKWLGKNDHTAREVDARAGPHLLNRLRRELIHQRGNNVRALIIVVHVLPLGVFSLTALVLIRFDLVNDLLNIHALPRNHLSLVGL